MNMDFAALSKMAKDATTKAKATATKLAEQAKERLEDTEGNKQMMQQFANKVATSACAAPTRAARSSPSGASPCADTLRRFFGGVARAVHVGW